MMHNDAFVGEEGKPSIIDKEKHYIKIPTLVKQELIVVKEVKQLGSSFASSVKTIMAGNFLLSLVFAGVLQCLWGMINSLQIMNLAILLGIFLPENLQIILIEVTKACNFDFFNTEDLFNNVFDFKETPSFSETFEAAGIEGSNFVLSIGTLFIFIVVLPAWLLFKTCLRKVCRNNCKNKICNSLFREKSNQLQIFTLFLLESCIQLGFSVCISIKFMSNDRFSTVWEAMSSMLVYIFAMALVSVPIYLTISGIRFNRAVKAKDEENIARYESLFVGKRVSSLLAIQHNTVFFIRRYLLIYVIVIYPDHIFKQLMLAMFASLISTSYTIVVKPYDDRAMNNQEAVNELTVLISTYLLYAFTNIIEKMSDLVMFGWISIGITCANILFNLLVMACISCFHAKLSIQRWYNLRKAKKI